MLPIPNRCKGCGKEKSQVRWLAASIAVTAEAQTIAYSVCDDCLGLQLIALATEKPELFEELVSSARAGAFTPQP
jgi:hypothetical protein